MTRKQTARRTKRKVVPKETTTVHYQLGPALIVIEQLRAEQAGPVIAKLVSVARKLQRKYPDLRTIWPTTGGYAPVDYEDDFFVPDNAKKTGFRVN